MRILSILFGVLFAITLNGQTQIERPKIVIGIVVDQMRNEYLQRYYSDFEDGGFKRLMNDGHYFSNMHYNYAPTYTGPGHASIYTGTTPSVHGIVGNYWYHRSEERGVYCTGDETCLAVGNEDEGGMSPNRLKTTTLSDELQLTTNMRSKSIAISIKDRGAILPGGHVNSEAYWMAKNGFFITSTFYMENLPEWVDDFNKKGRPAHYIKNGWETLRDMSEYGASNPDDNEYESRLGNKEKPVFPYDLTSMVRKGGLSSIKASPFGNNIVLEFAKDAIKENNLGGGEYTDMLMVSFSSPDYVGHAMGPRAVETQDTYLRLDALMADFLKFLDDKYGKDEYLVFLTADHGAAEVPTFLNDHGFNVNHMSRSLVGDTLKAWSMITYGENVIKKVDNNNVYFNYEVMSNKKIDKTELIEQVKDQLYILNFIKSAFSEKEILAGTSGNYFKNMIAAGYDVKQNGDIVFVPEPGYITYKSTGTTHGSAYNYDTHVPGLFFGWGVKSGRTPTRKTITQIAPTISQLIQIGMPSGSTSEVLHEVFK